MLKTSEESTLLAYVDHGDIEPFRAVMEKHGKSERVRFLVGPQIGPVRSANALAEAHPDYFGYGFVPDDAWMETPGWDKFCQKSLFGLRDHVGVVSPWTGQGEMVDMPFVSGEWIRRMGWYAPPQFYHFGWTAVLGVLGECTRAIHAKANEFSIRHKMESPANSTHLPGDKDNLYNFFTYYLSDSLRRLRKAT